MSIKLKRSISPDGFINSLTIEYDVPDDVSVDDARAHVDSIAAAFQAAHPVVQAASRGSFRLPAGASVAASAPPAAASQGSAVGTVFSVYPKLKADGTPSGPTIVQFADGKKVQTFDKKVGLLVGKTIEYTTKEKLFSGGGKATDLVAYKEVGAVAPIEAEGHANF